MITLFTKRLGLLALVLATISLSLGSPAPAEGKASGAKTTVDDALPPGGTVQGRFADRNGAGIPGVDVVLQSTTSHFHSTITDESGDYHLEEVLAGTYSVAFIHYELGILQYAHGQVDRGEADLITVTDGGTTTVDDTRLPTGSVHFTVTDSVTGGPVPAFTAHAGPIYIEGVDGSARAENVPIGDEPVHVFAQGYITSEQIRVQVDEGVTTEVAIVLVPTAKIRATVVDARTGSPVPGFCVKPVEPSNFSISDGCPTTGADGTVVIEDLSAGNYQLFAYGTPWSEPRSGYGAQWVGAHGGSGDQARAAIVKAVAGKTVNAPTIRLDKRGRITGTVTGTGGSAVERGEVSFGNLHYHSGSGVISFPVAADGSYSVDFLGPYRWPLHFSADGYAPQWSGNAGSRKHAREIRVKAQQAVAYDIRLVRGTRVTVRATENGWFAAYDAATGDNTGSCTGSSSAGCDMLVLGAQKVKFKVWIESADWWFGGSGFATATAVKISPSGTQTVTLAR